MAGRPSGGRSPKRRRLSRSAEFERVYRQGRSKSNRFLVLYSFPRADDPSARAGAPVAHADAPTARADAPDVRSDALAARSDALPDEPEDLRLGLSVSRRVGGAVERTRVKRVLREAFWAEAERLPAGSDYVVVARPDARELAERDGMAGVRSALAELVDALTRDEPARGARAAPRERPDGEAS